MREIIIRVEVPEDMDPETVAQVIIDDFYNYNKNTDDIGPRIHDIHFAILP